MENSGSQKAKIGLFTLVGIGILVAGIFLIGKQQSLFGNTFQVYGVFRNVSGLQVGNNVRFVGINVGTVENIQILSDTTAKVTLRMQSKVKDYIKTNSIASIGSDGLMGDKLITIAGNSEPAEKLKSGDKIATQNPLDFDKTIAKFTKVADNAEIITGALAGIATQVSSGKGSIGSLLYSDKLSKSIQGTVASANATVSSIKQSSEGFGQNMEALHHNFLLRGYFKKKEKKAEKKAEKADKAADQSNNNGK